MEYDIIMERMTFIMRGDELRRVKVRYNEYGEVMIVVDLHGMSCMEAKMVINNIIRMYGFSFTLDLIHGSNHGTAIKKLINQEIKNARIIRKYCNSWNPGETFLYIQ